jgi:hypothetical protein
VEKDEEDQLGSSATIGLIPGLSGIIEKLKLGRPLRVVQTTAGKQIKIRNHAVFYAAKRDAGLPRDLRLCTILHTHWFRTLVYMYMVVEPAQAVYLHALHDTPHQFSPSTGSVAIGGHEKYVARLQSQAVLQASVAVEQRKVVNPGVCLRAWVSSYVKYPAPDEIAVNRGGHGKIEH